MVRHCSDVAVVMMTAHGSEDLAVESMKKGALDYIAKPFSVEDLLQKVDRSLEFDKTRKAIIFSSISWRRNGKNVGNSAGMADMMVATDSDGRVNRINRATAEALGVDPDSPLGMPVEDLLKPISRLIASPCKVVLGTLSSCLDVSYSLHSRGRVIPVLSSATPFLAHQANWWGAWRYSVISPISRPWRRNGKNSSVCSPMI
ncbi:MAG: response regulator [Candidatus Moduliflexus flocculans]|nr:response regulator [Candidatus Moduliflexus flocculans]